MEGGKGTPGSSRQSNAPLGDLLSSDWDRIGHREWIDPRLGAGSNSGTDFSESLRQRGNSPAFTISSSTRSGSVPTHHQYDGGSDDTLHWLSVGAAYDWDAASESESESGSSYGSNQHEWSDSGSMSSGDAATTRQNTLSWLVGGESATLPAAAAASVPSAAGQNQLERTGVVLQSGGSSSSSPFASSSSDRAPTSSWAEDLGFGVPWLAEGEADDTINNHGSNQLERTGVLPSSSSSSSSFGSSSSDSAPTSSSAEGLDFGMPWLAEGDGYGETSSGTCNESTEGREREAKSNTLDPWIPDLMLTAPADHLAAHLPMLRVPLQHPTVQSVDLRGLTLSAGSATAKSRGRTAAASPARLANVAASPRGDDARVSQLMQQALREKIPSEKIPWTDVDLLLRSDTYPFQRRPAVLEPDVQWGIYRESPKQNRRKSARRPEMDVWTSSGGKTAALVSPKGALPLGLRIVRRYGSVKRSCPSASASQTLRYFEFSYEGQDAADEHGQQQVRVPPALQQRWLYQVYPHSAPRARRTWAGGSDARLMSDASITEVYHHLVAGEQGQSRLESRPDHVDDSGPVLFLEMQSKSRRRKRRAVSGVHSERALDKWQDSGGKNVVDYIRIPGVADRQILRRKGKVARDGLPSVKFNQFRLVDMRKQHTGAALVYQLCGIVGDGSTETRSEEPVRSLKRERDQAEDDQQPPDGARYRPQGRGATAAAMIGGTLMIMAILTRVFGRWNHASAPLVADVEFHCDVYNSVAFVSPRAKSYFDHHCCVSETATGGGTARQTLLQPEVQGGSDPPPSWVPAGYEWEDRCKLVSGVASSTSLSWQRLQNDIQTMVAHVDTRDTSTSPPTVQFRAPEVTQPHYIVNLRTSSMDSGAELSVSIVDATDTGFDAYVSRVSRASILDPNATLLDQPITLDMLDGLQVAWAAETVECNRASGTSPDTIWIVKSPHAVVARVPVEDADFSTSDPAIVVSLACNKGGRCENTAGGNVVYSLQLMNNLPAFFLVCVYAPKLLFADSHTVSTPAGVTRADANQLNIWGWRIHWIGTEDIRRGGQGELIETINWQSQTFNRRVDTSSAGIRAVSPQFFFSPAVTVPEPSTTLCVRIGLTTCKVPDRGYPVGMTSDEDKGLYSAEKCGTMAGFPESGGTRQQCGNYTLDLGCVDVEGKPICSQPVVNCTFVDAMADKNCPSLDVTVSGAALITGSVSSSTFDVVFSTLHPHDSQNPFAPELTGIPLVDMTRAAVWMGWTAPTQYDKNGRSVGGAGHSQVEMEAIGSTPLVMTVKWIVIPPSSFRRGRGAEATIQAQCDSSAVIKRLASGAAASAAAVELNPTAKIGAPDRSSSQFRLHGQTSAEEPPPVLPYDGSSCTDIYNRQPESRGRSGVYLILVQPKRQSAARRVQNIGAEQDLSAATQPFPVYCDMGSLDSDTDNTGGWTLVYQVAGSSGMASVNEVNRDSLSVHGGKLDSMMWGKLHDSIIRPLCTEQFRVTQTGAGDATPNALYCAFGDVDEYCDNCMNTNKRCSAKYRAGALGYTQLDESTLDPDLSRGFSTWPSLYAAPAQKLQGATVLQAAYDGVLCSDECRDFYDTVHEGSIDNISSCTELLTRSSVSDAGETVDIVIPGTNLSTSGFGNGKPATVRVPPNTGCGAFVQGERSRAELVGQCDRTCHAPVCKGCDGNFRMIGRRGSPACYGCCINSTSTFAAGARSRADAAAVDTDKTKTYHFDGGRPTVANWFFQNSTRGQPVAEAACKDPSAVETCSYLGGCRAQVWCRTVGSVKGGSDGSPPPPH